MKLVSVFRFLAFQSRVLVLAVSACSSNICGAAFAQDQAPSAPPIQVKTDEILVPVLVLDQKRIDAIHRMDINRFLSEVNAPNSQLLMNLAVTGLTAGEFHVFEDGKEQPVQRVMAQPGWKENLPVGPGHKPHGLPPGSRGEISIATYAYVELPHWPTYQISYAPPPSPSGSCHTVNVTVDRPKSYLYARSEYCNTTHAANDRLNGTPLGNRMAEDMGGKGGGPMRLMATAFGLFHDSAATYTVILLTSPRPFESVQNCTELPEIGFLGMIYSRDGKLVARFSGRELRADMDVYGHKFPMLAPTSSSGRRPCYFIGADSFETRLELPPGDYTLRAVIREGKKFGRTETPIHVESFDGMQLAISNLALARNFRQLMPGQQSNPAESPDQPLPLVSRGFQIFPTADTRFKSREALNFYLEVFSPLQSVPPAGKIEVHMRVLDADRGQVVKEVLSADTAPYSKPGNPIIPVGGAIDITNLPSGSYQLQARATDSTGQSTAWSSVAFDIQ